MSAQSKFISIILFLLSTAISVQAQEFTIDGIISDQKTGDPLELANVILETTDGVKYKGTATDINGLYQFNRVEAGVYIIRASYIGFQTYSDTLRLFRGKLNRKYSIEMVPEDESLDDVTITYKARNENLDAGQKKISRIDLKRVPTPAGSGDIASYLQTLPGVVSTGDRGGQLFVRGGTPDENMVLVDGTLIYQPFHIVGFFSAFPQELVSNADFYAGGFSSRYHGRTSSVLDVKLRNGNKFEYNGSASVSPFVAEVFAEGPLVKGKSSVVVSTRRSLIEGASSFYPSGTQPLRFDSQFLKVSNLGENGGSCSTHLMRTYDRGQLDYNDGDVFKWKNVVVGGRCSGLSGGQISLFDVNVGLSYVSNSAGQGGVGGNTSIEDAANPNNRFGRSSNATLFNIDVNLTQFVRKLRFDFGFFMNVKGLNYRLNEMFIGLESNSKKTYAIGTYLESVVPLGSKLEFQPGVSVSFSNSYDSSIEPRFRLSWRPRGKQNEEINLAAGVYRQSVAGITDSRDAGSSFMAWIPIEYGDPQIEARHLMAGWRQPVGEYLSFNLEGYYKELKNKPVAVWSTLAQFNTDVTKAKGTIYGGDFSLEYNSRRFFFSAGYGYSNTEYQTEQSLFNSWFGESIQSYHPSHDRRHKLNSQMSISLSSVSFNLRWQYGSGLPFTRPLGFDDLLIFDDQLPNIKYDRGLPRIILDRPYNSRLPDYHRLDFSVEKSFRVSFSQIDLQAGIINVYNKDNLFYYDVYTQRRINQLPFFPYVSFKMETLP